MTIFRCEQLRHCERSEAIQSGSYDDLDCRVALWAVFDSAFGSSQ